MFTTIDKALIALIMGVAFLINYFTPFHFAFSQDTATAIVGVLTPILVWLVPNKPA